MKNSLTDIGQAVLRFSKALLPLKRLTTLHNIKKGYGSGWKESDEIIVIHPSALRSTHCNIQVCHHGAGKEPWLLRRKLRKQR